METATKPATVKDDAKDQIRTELKRGFSHLSTPDSARARKSIGRGALTGDEPAERVSGLDIMLKAAGGEAPQSSPGPKGASLENSQAAAAAGPIQEEVSPPKKRKVEPPAASAIVDIGVARSTAQQEAQELLRVAERKLRTISTRKTAEKA